MFKKIISIFSILVLLFLALVYIDYFLVKNKGTLPKIALKETNSMRQSVIYKGLFYRVINCMADNSTIITGYGDDEDVCPRKVKYVDGFFVNSKGLKISKENYTLMSYLNIYTFNNIDKMSTDEEVKDAAYVSYNYGINQYIIKENSTIEIDGKIINIAIFPSFDYKDDEYKFIIDETNTQNFKCAIADENDYLFAEYDAENNTCIGEFKKITMTNKWCKLYKNSTLIYSINHNKYCNN